MSLVSQPVVKDPVSIDTGPLLCFGHISGGIRILLGRYRSRLMWARAVAEEVDRHAAMAPRTHVDRCRKEAAGRWRGPSRVYLGEPQNPNPAAVQQMRALVRAASSRASLHPQADLGESESLAIAQVNGATLLTNEDAARRVASNLNLAFCCTLDVLVAEYNERKISLLDLKASYEQLRNANLDSGEVITRFAQRELGSWPRQAPAAN